MTLFGWSGREEVLDGEAVPGHHCHLSVVQNDGVPGEIDECVEIGSDEVARIPDAKDQGALFLGAENPVALGKRENSDGEAPLQLPDGPPEGVFQIQPAGHDIFNQMGNDFRVGFGMKGVALAMQLLRRAR